MPRLLWHVVLVSSEGLSHSIASYKTQGDVEELFLPGLLRVTRILYLLSDYDYVQYIVNFAIRYIL
jgi:hypothetical protein